MVFMGGVYSRTAKLYWIGCIGKLLERPFNLKPASKVLLRSPTEWLLIEVDLGIVNSPKCSKLLGSAFEAINEPRFRLRRILPFLGELYFEVFCCFGCAPKVIPKLDNGFLLHSY